MSRLTETRTHVPLDPSVNEGTDDEGRDHRSNSEEGVHRRHQGRVLVVSHDGRKTSIVEARSQSEESKADGGDGERRSKSEYQASC